MSKIESIIEFDCVDDKPSDCDWTLRKKDVTLIAENIKRLLLDEVMKAPHTWEDAIDTIKEL